MKLPPYFSLQLAILGELMTKMIIWYKACALFNIIQCE